MPPPQAPHKRFCCERHQRIAEKRRYRGRHTELARCARCGESFERTATSKRIQVYCSKLCQYRGRSFSYRQRLDIQAGIRRAQRIRARGPTPDDLEPDRLGGARNVYGFTGAGGRVTAEIGIPFRSRSDSLADVADAASALPIDEDRAVVRQLVLGAAADGVATAGELLDRLEKATPAERRQTLDRARVAAGLPTIGEVDARARVDAASRAGRLRQAQESPWQLCLRRGATPHRATRPPASRPPPRSIVGGALSTSTSPPTATSSRAARGS